MKLTLDLARDTYEELGELSAALGFPPEMAAEYAIRMVCACAREGLIEDVPMRAWPREARAFAGARGKVIDMDPERRRKGIR